MSGTAVPGLRQVLWVAAGVVLLSLLVVAASWLFSPRPSGIVTGPSAFKMPEQRVEKSTFQPEKPGASVSAERFGPETGPRSDPGTSSSVPLKTDSRPSPEPVTAPKPALRTPIAPSIEPTPPPKAPAPQPLPETKPQGTPAQPKNTPPSPPTQTRASKGIFGVQVGAFSSPDNARSISKKLEAQQYRVTLVPAGKATKVVVSGFPDRASAEKALAALRAAGYDGAFVVPLE
jgi:cell division protein FtsN